MEVGEGDGGRERGTEEGRRKRRGGEGRGGERKGEEKVQLGHFRDHKCGIRDSHKCPVYGSVRYPNREVPLHMVCVHISCSYLHSDKHTHHTDTFITPPPLPPPPPLCVFLLVVLQRRRWVSKLQIQLRSAVNSFTVNQDTILARLTCPE